ncbi:MAG: SDR family oxidoreductase [Janthinobacterium lividum]
MKSSRRAWKSLPANEAPVGNASAFLCSDLASGIRGEILYVDGGFNTTAMGDLGE